MNKFNSVIPLSLYIHIPWCVRKCPYCDFNSHATQGNLPEELYISALLNDLDEQLPKIWGRRIVSIFFGGGTPSLFSPKAIEKILLGVHQRLNFGCDIEITLEANPGTVDEKNFAGFRKAGVNRLSIGLQSLQTKNLISLGRIHDREQALRAIDAANKAGFENFNLDLMHGLPNQSLTDSLADLEDALQFSPPHLSWYQLTIEPNTFFYRHPPVLPEEETLWEIQEKGEEKILTSGLTHYEVSAFARSGYECIHNKNYWEFGDYLGLGAGAHSKITDVEKNTISRHWQMRNPNDYLNPEKTFTAKNSILSNEDIRFEFMLNALRLTQGVPLSLFSERTGLPLATLEPQLTFACEKNLLIVKEDFLRTTELGQRFLNNIIGFFLTST